jgi:hypothetical protein
MVAFLGFYAAAELSHFVEIVPRVPVSAVKFVRWYLGYGLSCDYLRNENSLVGAQARLTDCLSC